MKKSRVLSSKRVLRTKAFTVREDRLSFRDQEFTRAVVEHPGAVVIIPVTKRGNLLVLRQYRHAIGKLIYEFPAGTLGKNERPLACAKREIAEETGFRAKKWHSLGTLYPTPGFCDEIQHLFVASELEHAPLPGDEDEYIETEERSVSWVEKSIRDGKFSDAKSIAILYRARLAKLL
jgi:ADP-ribose pyrophosphatase